MNNSSLNEIESVDRTCIKIEYSCSAPIALANISTNLYPQNLKPSSILKLRSICSRQPGRTDWKSFSTISRVSISLFTAQAISRSFLGVLTNASSPLLLARTPDLL